MSIFQKKKDIAGMKKYTPIFKWISITAIHFIFWIGVYFFFTYFLGYGSKNTAYINKFSLFLMPVTICTSYFFFFFLIPNYLLQKKQGLFILYTIYTFIISSFFIILSILYGLVFCYHLTTDNASPLTKTIPFIVLGIYFIVLIVIMLGLVIHNYKSALKSEDLKSKFLETQLQLKEQELKYLKMQIHPHFLFNTLNTLYGFALKRSQKTPEIILKLSSLLDYILYQVDKSKVSLQNEINHIQNYIELEKIRFQDSLEVHFHKEEIDPKIEVPPMLFLPFIENAFKHGIPIHGKLMVDIIVHIKQDSIHFSVVNSSGKTKQHHGGIGLANLKQRLHMLYKDNATLIISELDNKFHVELKIPIKNES